MNTPLPWLAVPVEDIGKNWLICHVGRATDNMKWIITTDHLHASEGNGADAKDDAKFIVRACNSHDDLLAAAKALLTTEGDGTASSMASQEKQESLRLAIAKAES